VLELAHFSAIPETEKREGWGHFMVCMKRLHAVSDVKTARSILRAFIKVRSLALVPEVPIPEGLGNHPSPSPSAFLGLIPLNLLGRSGGRSYSVVRSRTEPYGA
jgi:hypothetical protein